MSRLIRAGNTDIEVKMRLLYSLLIPITLGYAQPPEPLRLEKTIPLPAVQGRIDHMSIDLKNQRLFVAALGNDTIEVIDIRAAKRMHTISGVREPQGLLYVPDVDRLYAANAKDGTLRIFDAMSWKLLQTIELGDDADNIRYDAARKHIYVGYGSGALGELDPDGKRIADIKLDAHPESFQLEQNGPRIFVNLPHSEKIAVIDRQKQSIIATWQTGRARGNFPMALDEPDHRLFVICRSPAQMIVLDTTTGKVIQTLPCVGDSDDVFYDRERKRIYASGGEGAVWVYQQQDADHYKELARIATVKGARTSFFSPDLSRLFVAARAEAGRTAEIRMYGTQD
jgi:DNA-binding beta-propeller fold protein YncE